jgi:hypothetical protein
MMGEAGAAGKGSGCPYSQPARGHVVYAYGDSRLHPLSIAMIAELALFLTTPISTKTTPRPDLFRAIGLWSRARRCKRAWADHEARTKAAIHAAIDATTSRRSVVVLGSGLLRDIPIERLSAMFRQVVLIDIVHLSSVRLTVLRKRLRNVRFETRDLSGYDQLIERRMVQVQTGQDDIGGRLDPLGFLRRIPDLDLVLSVNLLSQIGVGVAARLKKPNGRDRFLPADAVAQIITAHFEGLASVSCRTCFVGDVSYVLTDRAGNVIDSHDLLFGVEPPFIDDEWNWTVAPFGEESADYERVHHVIAVQNVAMELRS